MDFVFDSSLALYLPLDELDGSSLASRDAYGHLGTVTGALWTSRGRTFDGVDDQINCGQAASLNITSAITVEMWVKSPFDQVGGSASRFMLSKGGDSSRGYAFYLERGSTWVYWIFRDGGVGKEIGYAATANAWFHMLGTYDGTSAKLYINGTQSGSTLSYTGDIDATPTDNLLLGTDGTRYANCTLGEVRVYHRALNALEVRHNYLATKGRYQ